MIISNNESVAFPKNIGDAVLVQMGENLLHQQLRAQFLDDFYPKNVTLGTVVCSRNHWKADIGNMVGFKRF